MLNSVKSKQALCHHSLDSQPQEQEQEQEQEQQQQQQQSLLTGPTRFYPDSRHTSVRVSSPIRGGEH